MNFEYLDDAPDGHVMTMLSGKLKVLGIPIFERRWRTHDGIEGHDEYVPEWADRIMNDFMMDSFANAAFPIVERLAVLDPESQRAAMTVLELGGMRELARFIEMSEDFIAENITPKTLA